MNILLLFWRKTNENEKKTNENEQIRTEDWRFRNSTARIKFGQVFQKVYLPNNCSKEAIPALVKFLQKVYLRYKKHMWFQQAKQLTRFQLR